jgi:hypothetical protein
MSLRRMVLSVSVLQLTLNKPAVITAAAEVLRMGSLSHQLIHKSDYTTFLSVHFDAY